MNHEKLIQRLRQSLAPYFMNYDTVRDFGRDTVFPSSPRQYDRIFRQDRGLQYYYDGTQWLTTNEYSTFLTFYSGAEPVTSTSTTNSARIAIMPGDARAYFTYLIVRPNFNSPNDINDYWDFDYTYGNATLASFTTQGLSSGFTTFTQSTFTQSTTTDTFVRLNITRVNSAGTFGPRVTLVRYRLVG